MDYSNENWKTAVKAAKALQKAPTTQVVSVLKRANDTRVVLPKKK